MKKIVENIQELKEIDKRLKKIKDEYFTLLFDTVTIDDDNVLVCTKNDFIEGIVIPETMQTNAIRIFENDICIDAFIKDTHYLFKFKNVDSDTDIVTNIKLIGIEEEEKKDEDKSMQDYIQEEYDKENCSEFIDEEKEEQVEQEDKEETL